MNDEDYQRQTAWKRAVLSAMGADPDAFIDPPTPVTTPMADARRAGHAHARRVADQARLARGQWVRAGNMEVRLS